MSEIARAETILRAACDERVRTRFPMAPLTTFRIGGPAALYLEPESIADLAAAGRAVAETGIGVAVIGKGSNILVSDDGFDGLVLRLGRGFRWSSRDGHRLTAGGAMPLPALSGIALRFDLAGLEFGVAIPATLGGAVRMNAGAHARSMSDVVATIDVFRLGDQSLVSLAGGEAGFGYRRSTLPDDGIVIGATVALEPGEPDAIRGAMDEAREWRRRTQPLAEPNCGSVFENPPDGSAARLIDAAGGKGMRVGGASVSVKHANFIVTEPGARANDVVELVRRLRVLVEERSGVRLEPEVHLIGGFVDVPH
jgi:UDP-N-acetylmuramate dehydrogenase